ncbi:hypothetical protein FBZ87_108117 [Nitrospirillum amazonense]|uniref:Uncharacterized protein n=1 Tax=Nitrospirillum amazonense TaxID=28077 RepID=A0A560JFT2_9PROT|nr:hypothetical protein [Nitrospirillum amazonense]TWB69827.1 hypothetical protein FBZ87_108117 [Nitrospirillum amazonense]
MPGSILFRATLAGTALQVAMVVAGHYVPVIADFFAVGGMAISALAGFLYGRTRTGLSIAVMGGALVGGACALIGILVSWRLGDVPAVILALGTALSVFTGALGGLAGWLFRDGYRGRWWYDAAGR